MFHISVSFHELYFSEKVKFPQIILLKTKKSSFSIKEIEGRNVSGDEDDATPSSSCSVEEASFRKSTLFRNH